MIPERLEMIRRLVAIPSMSSARTDWDRPNRPVAQTYAQWLEDAGFRVELVPVHGPSSGKVNVIATKGRGASGLVLAGHTDTVPYDETSWEQDPFELSVRDGRAYGLGTSDMKAFLAIALEAAAGFSVASLTHALTLVATADEESTMEGAATLAALGRPVATRAVIGEPTDSRPVVGHKGIAMEVVEVRGRTAHASNPALGNNAIDGMHRVLSALMRWRAELAERYSNTSFEVPNPTLNFGMIRGGDVPNRVCGRCELHLEVRPLPGMALPELRIELGRRVADALAGTGLEHSVHSMFRGVPAYACPKDSPLVRAACELSGFEPSLAAFGTEAPFFAELGMQVLIMGPGKIALAHQPNEYVELAALEDSLRQVRGLIGRFCEAS